MKAGANIGQRYEAVQQSRDPEKVYNILTALYNKGFRCVRIPVTWRPAGATQDLFELNSPVLDQLTRVVDRALLLGFWVIINTHHEDWLNDKFDGGNYWSDKFRALWVKIASHFRDRSFKLMFEIFNEPHGVFGDYRPGGLDPNLPRCLELTRKINQIGYEAVRSVNLSRIILLQPNAQGNIEQAPRVYPTADLLPGGGKDRWLCVTIHSYDMWSLCGPNGSDSVYSSRANPIEALRQDINGGVSRLKMWYDKITVAAPTLGLHMGEIGVGRVDPSRRNTDLIREYYRFWGKRLREEGIALCCWCDGPWAQFAMIGTADNGATITFPYGLVDAFLTYQK